MGTTARNPRSNLCQRQVAQCQPITDLAQGWLGIRLKLLSPISQRQYCRPLRQQCQRRLVEEDSVASLRERVSNPSLQPPALSYYVRNVQCPRCAPNRLPLLSSRRLTTVHLLAPIAGPDKLCLLGPKLRLIALELNPAWAIPANLLCLSSQPAARTRNPTTSVSNLPATSAVTIHLTLTNKRRCVLSLVFRILSDQKPRPVEAARTWLPNTSRKKQLLSGRSRSLQDVVTLEMEVSSRCSTIYRLPPAPRANSSSNPSLVEDRRSGCVAGSVSRRTSLPRLGRRRRYLR